ncbi:restriction endonuclease subunit S [Streptomyces koyangensis]
MEANDVTIRGASLARGLGRAEELHWPLKRSDELFELQYGKALVKSDRRPGEVPVYGTNGQTGWHDSPLFKGPGVVLGRKGVGHLGVEWVDHDFWVIDTAYSLRTKFDIDLKFAYYLIRHVGLDHLKHGTSNPSLTRDGFAAQLFPVPPDRAQRAIAAVLGTIDDKIESNRRLTELIPQLIRAHVTAGLQKASIDIPVANLARFVNGGAYTKGATGTGRMVIRIAELNSGPGASTVYNDIDVPKDKTAHPGDILMSWSGSLGVYRWHLDEAIVNQHIFKVLPTGYPAWLVFDRLDAVIKVFQGIAKDKATTMGHIQRGHLESTTVALPEADRIPAFNRQIEPLWDRLLTAEQEIVRLESLQSALLPELLSGRLRISEELGAVA